MKSSKLTWKCLLMDSSKMGTQHLHHVPYKKGMPETQAASVHAHIHLCTQLRSPMHIHVYACNCAHLRTYTPTHAVTLTYAHACLRMQSRSPMHIHAYACSRAWSPINTNAQASKPLRQLTYAHSMHTICRQQAWVFMMRTS